MAKADLSDAELGDAFLRDAGLEGATGLMATRLCQAKTLFQTTGVPELLLAEVEKQCPLLLENPSGQ